MKGIVMLAVLKNGIQVPYEELWLNDEDLAEFAGKSKETIQKQLRRMYKVKEYRPYIDKIGGRSTKLSAYEKWRKSENIKIKGV